MAFCLSSSASVTSQSTDTVSCVLEAGLHVVGNDAAHALHGDDLVVAGLGGAGFSGRRGCWGAVQGGLVGQDVLFGDGAVLARAGNLRQIDAELFGCPAGGRHGAHVAGGRLAGRRGLGRGRLGRAFSSGLALRRPGIHVLAGLANDGNDALDGGRLALGDQNLQQDAALGNLHHVRDLVCFHFQERFALFNSFPLLHRPAGDLAGLHGQAPLGHLHFICHAIYLLAPETPEAVVCP